jgi:hypothetical protein
MMFQPTLDDRPRRRGFDVPLYEDHSPSAAAPQPDEIMELGAAYRRAKTLLTAVELGLFTALAQEPQDAETLRRRLDLHPRAARDFFDALVALGMIERHDGIYSNTPATDLYLDAAKPTYLGGILELANTRLYGDWSRFTEAVRSGLPQNGTATNTDAFETIYRDPQAVATFLRGMTGLSRMPAAVLARRIRWSEHRVIIDVGAAEGCVPVEIARHHPHLTGGGFDLPVVRETFETYVERHGLSDRLRFYPGDFLTGPLPSADVLVMGHILHDWDLAVKRDLLAKAHAALPPGGLLIVYDQMIDDDRRENVEGLLTSLSMLLQTPGGFDYTGAECAGWMRDAGFAEVQVAPLWAAHSMALGIK